MKYIQNLRIELGVVIFKTIMENKYVIIDLRNMDYMKDEEGKICVYDTLDKAGDVCGMYEFEDAWVCQLIYNHKETI